MTIALPRSDDPRVSIIIPSSIRTDLLHACLSSLARHAPTIPYETIVVLNESEPAAEARLREAVSGVEFARSSVNLGIAGSANRGRSLARGEFLLLLHDDAEVLPGWMEALVDTADAYPETGAVGSRILNPDGSLQHAGAIVWASAQTSQRWGAAPPPPPSAFERPHAADTCVSASLLVRASAWDAVGGPDENFYPSYFVDTDLCMALRQAGYVVACQPGSQVHHRRGSSTKLRFRVFLYHRHRELFGAKWATALTQHEPFDDESPASIARAIARTEAAAEQARNAFTPRETPQLRPFDAARQISEHAARAQPLRDSYLAYLEKFADECEIDRNGWRDHAGTLVRQKQDLERERDALLRSGKEPR
jgi:GT2 family glycosyltransferase